ncbi:MAG: mRNA surveillance protein pelota [Promethearchaeota archaeon]
MKILEIDNKNQEVIVKIETLNDLWTLYNVISKNDYVSTRTSRRVVLREGTKGERKKMWIKLKVESVSFHEFSNRLRVKGTISEGPEDFVSFGTYHTFNIEVGNELSIIKEMWLRSEIKRLTEFSKFDVNFVLLIIAIESGLANAALITNFSHTRIATIKKTIPGKRYEQIHRNKADEEFFGDINKVLDENVKNININLIILCGPGNIKDKFLKYLKDKKQPDYLSKINIIHASSGTESAIFETLKSPQLKNLKEKVKIFQETDKIEKIFAILATDPDLIAIGVKEISNLSKSGVIEELFITDILIRGISKEKKLEIEEILTDIEKSDGKYYILSSEQPTGQQIIALGDIVAILRYKP